MPKINMKSCVDCSNKISTTTTHTVSQIPKQNLQNVNMQDVYCASEPFKKNSKTELIKKIYGWFKQMRANTKAFGVSLPEMITSSFHSAPAISVMSLFGKIESHTTLATVPLKQRNSSKTINATLEKLDFGDGDISYVLKNKGKQLGHLDITRNAKDVYIDFMTNIFGRKKYRNTENILLQAMIEDCMKQGFVPDIKAVAMNVGDHMGRGYNNRSLYQRMGMESTGDGYMRISAEKVLELINKQKAKFGTIIQ